ncbi:MAG: PHP domain-containing protein [Anaerolineae bacterium]|nr:PHP domain-containing protein [Anaerolineae bacterium]
MSTSPLWKIELHAHTIYSKDCLTRLDKLQDICKQHGIDKLAITDHNSARAALQMAHLYPMWIIPGEEIMTTEGELLAWYIKEEIPPHLTPKETITRLRAQNAVIGIAHPFDRYRRGAWQRDQLMQIVDLVDCIEVFNARCIHNEDNHQALAFAQEHNKLMTCGSDAHSFPEYGKAVVKARPFANTADGLRQALQDATREERLSNPLIHFSSRYAKWMKALFPSMRPQ